jgi:hypothetical protein
MKLDGGYLVAVVAILANLLVTWTTLRHQRKTTHDGRVWDQRLKVYEGYCDYLIGDMGARHDRMSAPEGPELSPLIDLDAEDRRRIESRVHLYASDEVRDALTDVFNAEQEWRTLEYDYDQDPGSVPLADRVRRAFLADTLTGRAMETMSREVRSARPGRLMLRKGAELELPGWLQRIAPNRTGDGRLEP